MKLKKGISFMGCAILAFSMISTSISNCFAAGGSNYISKMNVDIYDRDSIGRKLDELCRQFDHTRGIQVDGSYSDPRYDQSAYQYFFRGNGKYFELLPNRQLILAQCIEAMYLNKDNDAWHEVIDCALMVLSSHGGGCVYRAESLLNEVNHILCYFLNENNIGCESSDDDAEDLLENVSPDLEG